MDGTRERAVGCELVSVAHLDVFFVAALHCIGGVSIPVRIVLFSLRVASICSSYICSCSKHTTELRLEL
jgi:hypothetical protein